MLLSVQDIYFTYHMATTITKNCNSSVTLDYISFNLHHNEKVALIGANGSGKSTLLLIIAGCLTPQNGNIILMNDNITGHPKKAGKYTGLLFQNPDVQLLLPSVREELLFALQTSNVSIKNIYPYIDDIALQYGCFNLLDSPPQRLSSGEKQRVALAVLLAMHPTLLLLDEPTAALDPRARKNLIYLLQQIETTALIATHDLDMALSVTNRVLLLNNGTLIADGPTKELLSDADLLEKNQLELPLTLQSSII